MNVTEKVFKAKQTLSNTEDPIDLLRPGDGAGFRHGLPTGHFGEALRVLELSFTGAEAFLNLLLRGDVDGGADQAKELVASKTRRSGIENPAVLAVEAAEPAHCLKARAGFVRRVPGTHITFEIVGMNSGGPAGSQLLFYGGAGKLHPPLVDERAILVGIADPDNHRRAIGDGSEALFAFAQGGFGTDASADVARDPDDTDDVPARVAEGHLGGEVSTVPGRAGQALFDKEILARFDDGSVVFHQAHADGGVGKDLRVGFPADLVKGLCQNGEGGGVGEQESALAVLDVNRVRADFGDGLEKGFGPFAFGDVIEDGDRSVGLAVLVQHGYRIAQQFDRWIVVENKSGLVAANGSSGAHGALQGQVLRVNGFSFAHEAKREARVRVSCRERQV